MDRFYDRRVFRKKFLYFFSNHEVGFFGSFDNMDFFNWFKVYPIADFPLNVEEDKIFIDKFVDRFKEKGKRFVVVYNLFGLLVSLRESRVKKRGNRKS
jgi:hypothetical protein